MKKAKPAKRAKAKKTDAEARPGSDDSIKANSGSDDDDSIRARSGYAARDRASLERLRDGLARLRWITAFTASERSVKLLS
ncbi:MAG: hypothetical protein WCD65_16335 [Pseudolabrys sp.]